MATPKVPKVSVKQAVRDASLAERKALKAPPAREGQGQGTHLNGVQTVDSFVNFGQRLGVGADNALAGSTYGFNPITRNRIQLEWIHRGSWLGGLAVDIPADDMTRKGVEYVTELPPEDTEKLDLYTTALHTWDQINEVIRWGRLYGGCLGVMLIDGQDTRTPFSIKTLMPGQYKGMIVLDRWMVDPVLEDLVTEMGPHLGLPKYYRVGANAPALRGQVIHYTRVAFRILGLPLPYSQALTENLWGISVLERIWDRMIGFDSATTGITQLVYKAYIRVLKIKGLRDVVAAGGKALDGLTQYTELMRRYQGIEGVSMLDGEDDLQALSQQAFSGLSDVLTSLGQQVSGALQIPLVRLFGQSPAGLNSTGESDWRMYCDYITNQQQKHLYHGVSLIYRVTAKSADITLPPNFAVKFRSLKELDEKERAELANTLVTAIVQAHEASLLSDQAAMQELRQASRTTGLFTNITEEAIEAAAAQVAPPPAAPIPGMPPADPAAPAPEDPDLDPPATPAEDSAPTGALNAKPQEARPNRKTVTVPTGKSSRVMV